MDFLQQKLQMEFSVSVQNLKEERLARILKRIWCCKGLSALRCRVDYGGVNCRECEFQTGLC